MKNIPFIVISCCIFFSSCKKDSENEITPDFNFLSAKVNDKPHSLSINDININPVIKINVSVPVKRSSVPGNITLTEYGYSSMPVNYNYENNDSTIVIRSNSSLKHLTRYIVYLAPDLESVNGKKLNAQVNVLFVTSIDSSDKFPVISDNQLLDKVQQQTFKYFWELGHPVSGMARERNTSGDLVTTGGTGFGIMAIITAVNRNFITRIEGRDRILKIANFLTNNAVRYHGAFSHWINGATGATMPFGSNDNGADIVETSFLMEGMICAKQYFNGADPVEADLRNKINGLVNGVQWNWFRQNGQNVLYWHWSPDKGWIINAQVRGWNEALITYVLASSSLTDSIPKIVYDNGWASNGGMRNGNTYYSYPLPLGPALGGPLFFEHYSFQGINPNGLADGYANYQVQATNHTMINYEYCKANPRGWYGYSASCWGLTASDIPEGYSASSPTNDRGVIAPTAALSSMPYTPAESMAALKFFYYKLGDKLWGDYGFYDAFKLSDAWFASSTLAIDQGPIIVMIENYRSQLLWNLFTSAPEIKNGLRRLGFTAPYL